MKESKRMQLQMFQQVHLISIIIIITAVVLLIKEARSAASNSMAKPNCQEKCGNLSVPYPFGIGKGCCRNQMFEVTCNESTLFYMSDVQVFQISLDHVSITGPAIVQCYNKSSGESPVGPVSYGLEESPFRVSHTQNKLVAIGCDIFAYFTDLNTTNYRKGCASICYNNTSSSSRIVGLAANNYSINPTSCSGIGCCQTDIPEDIYSFNLHIETINTIGRLWASAPCSIAFIADKNFSEFSKPNASNITDYDFLDGVPLVLDWAIESISCREAQRRKDYACGRNSDCIKSIIDDGVGYRCRCSQGYQGNPYLNNGCQDIDECENTKKNKCPDGALCNNTAGSYLCTCPPGYYSIHGNGINCIPDHGKHRLIAVPVSIGIGVAIGVIFFIAVGLWLYRKLELRQNNKMKQQFFKRNGGLLLQQHVSSGEESVEKTKVFKAEELEKATDNFNEGRVLGKGGLGTVYKGMLSNGSIVAVKKSNIVNENQVGQFINEVIILSRISHRNIVKLLGCCLETEVPLLVYEYVSNGTLSHHLHDEGKALTMSWNTRLRIAGEIAGALTYLHSYASTSIFHRDIKSSNILLDENYKAVVSDFGLSRSVSLDKTHLTTMVGGTFGYLDPEYFRSGQLTDKSDVYAFGVVLAELLTGKKAVSSDRFDEGLVLNFRSSMKQNRLFEILETVVVNEGKEDEIQAVATLAKRCLKLTARKRPNMKEVVGELDQLRRAQEQSTLLKYNNQDSYCSISERCYSSTTDAFEEEN
ncbi:wall-associated receptor kinase-like 1 [Cornus florida]|uniref:wall-associated receptor kinase-like 1 n=1 Tax=Cornus florida TaxID=4283 RepID=UPI00289D0D1D|nr:wall-associated receptor kinase-like 1 [Cornus florida]